MFILLLGKRRSGKDTSAKIIQDYFKEKYNLTFFDKALACPLKVFVALQNGISLETLEKNKYMYRSELIKTGTNLRKAFGDQFFCESLLQETFDGSSYIVTDIRNKMELNYFSEKVPSISIKLIRNEQVEENKDADNHEKEVDTLTADITIQNDGNIDDLKQKIISELEKYISENAINLYLS